MPEQQFLDPCSEELLAIVSWDFGYGTIALAYRGMRVAAFNGLDQLRTGVSGPTADGNTVAIRVTQVNGMDVFQVAFNGEVLSGKQPNFAAGGPSSQMAVNSDGMAERPTISLTKGGQLVVNGKKVQKALDRHQAPRKANGSAITTGRVWAGAFAGLSLGFGYLLRDGLSLLWEGVGQNSMLAFAMLVILAMVIVTWPILLLVSLSKAKGGAFLVAQVLLAMQLGGTVLRVIEHTETLLFALPFLFLYFRGYQAFDRARAESVVEKDMRAYQAQNQAVTMSQVAKAA